MIAGTETGVVTTETAGGIQAVDGVETTLLQAADHTTQVNANLHLERKQTETTTGIHLRTREIRVLLRE